MDDLQEWAQTAKNLEGIRGAVAINGQSVWFASRADSATIFDATDRDACIVRDHHHDQALDESIELSHEDPLY